MKLAIFDLDNTLLGGDSDHAWGEFLIKAGLVEPIQHRNRNDEFYQQYLYGGLDIHDYVAFTINPIKTLNAQERNRLHAEFMQEFVQPMLLPAATALLQTHREQGHHTLIITATNEFITAPIARILGADTLLATELEMADGVYTGRIRGVPSFREGKVTRLQQWLSSVPTAKALSLDDSIFYSDSINDLPLLQAAAEAVAVDPDPRLAACARENGWPIISLR
ncbi:MAG: HAD family hydrolase [Pseudomonadales bacterium]|nr:HAD family hydrolase [Pseudomonadales bacterium]